jgi:hypothetical protein
MNDEMLTQEDLIEYAWGIIANVSGSDWTQQSEVWQGAAAKWRDQYHDYLRTLEIEIEGSDIEFLTEEELEEVDEIVDNLMDTDLPVYDSGDF